MNGLTIASQGSINAVGDQAWQVKGIGDFDGDGRADILWRNLSTGENYLWLMNGLSTASEGSVNFVDPASGWQVQGVGDFDGDGKADILWRNTSTGENYIYLMNGLTIASQGSINAVGDQAWQVKGIGDFDGDGKSDILWRNAVTGENYIWLMNGLSAASQGSVNFVDPASGWEVQGIGDFDGDGKADLLWRNTSTGENYIYLMNGLTIATPGSINAVSDQAWQVKGIGDFDGDGKADILWRNAVTGENYIWLMNGLSAASQGSVNFVDPASGWEVQAVGDFDPYTTLFLSWRNTSTGENYIYLMNGLTIARPGSINAVGDQAWQEKGTGDFDGDGNADLLWPNAVTGENHIRRMNGLRTASRGSVNFVAPASGWHAK